MRRKLAVAVLAGLLPGPAAALSCAEYSVTDTYWYHTDRPETFVLALGTFQDFQLIKATSAKALPQDASQGHSVYSARFEGFRASANAFDQPFSTEVTLAFPDFSAIGGGSDTAELAIMLPGMTGLVWLMETSRGYEATVELCTIFIDPDPASVKPALDCLGGRHCPRP